MLYRPLAKLRALGVYSIQSRRLVEPPSLVVAGVRTVTTHWQVRYTLMLLRLLYKEIKAVS
jgi:hypothetical protein